MTHQTCKIFLLCLILGNALACQSDGQAEVIQKVPEAYTEHLRVAEFHSDEGVQNRILNLTFQETQARLTSLLFEAESTMTFRRGEEKWEQKDNYEAAVDALGQQRIILNTPEHQVEAYLFGDTLYIGQDQGKLREKDARGLELSDWGELAYSSLAQALAPFRPKLSFSQPSPVEVGNRAALRFNLETKEVTPAPAVTELPSHGRPVRIPALWRELSQATDIEGYLTIDRDTGVILRSKITGKLEVSDREVHPTQLVVQYQSGITEIGNSQPLTKPERTSPEVRRSAPVSKPLHFFRKQLKKQADENPKEDQKG
ncbi:MAG: hypothetical protein HOI23_16795 [Deltaproteobacteria bacterium]|nr:hypothetical protein [Deltaproteobacteria bacterium]